MTKIIKINRSLNNINLPVLTENGLENYYYAKFVANLSRQSYTMTETQDTSMKAFFSNLANNGIADYIQAIFPFMGTSENVNAAKVAMYSDSLFDFPANFNGIVYDNGTIVGISKTPAISTLKLSDVQPTGTFTGVAYSFNKSATETTTNNDKLLNFNNKYQIRLQNNDITIYARQDNGNYSTMGGGSPLPNFEDAGSVYMAFLQNNSESSQTHLKYQEMGEMVRIVSKTGGRTELSSDDASSTLSSTSSYSVVDVLTSVVFFKKMIPEDKLALFVNEWKALVSALGKTV